MSEPQIQHVVESRTGKRPIAIPDGVTVQVDGQRITIKGPKGTHDRELPSGVVVETKDKELKVGLDPKAGRDAKRQQGLARALVTSMLEGAAKGYDASLDLYGVGYRAEVKGQTLNLALGLSHGVTIELPEAVKGRVETIDEAGIKRPRLHLSSHDKQLLGEVAAKIKSKRPPEPYKGKGVRFTGERIREKAGKAAAGSKKG